MATVSARAVEFMYWTLAAKSLGTGHCADELTNLHFREMVACLSRRKLAKPLLVGRYIDALEVARMDVACPSDGKTMRGDFLRRPECCIAFAACRSGPKLLSTAGPQCPLRLSTQFPRSKHHQKL